MVEIKTLTFTYKEIVEAMIKHQDLHEGIWQLYIEFGIGAANITTGEEDVSPSAIVPVKKIGLHKVDKESPIAVDASKVNPQIS
jgi:hypothetical protein